MVVVLASIVDGMIQVALRMIAESWMIGTIL
jgi:hypothetical protein